MDRFRPPQLNNSNDPSNTPRTFSFDNQSSRLQFNDRVIIRELDPALVPPAPRPVLDINLLPTPDETPRTSSQSPRQRLLAFFGVGSAPEVRQRKELLSFLWNVVFNSIQIVVIIALLIYSSLHKSTSGSGLSEWKECSKPLGIWDSLWAVKLSFDSLIAYWSFRRERAMRTPPAASDPESLPRNLPRGPISRPTRAGNNTSHYYSPGPETPARTPATLPYSNLYARLSIVLSFLSFVWFVATNILIYSSLYACRVTSPHLWWLTFGILCITYLMILELFLLGLLVFIVGPIVYLIWGLVMICLGRHPLQNPHYIKPEIGKLSKSVVDRIPLVLYIPAPPEADPTTPDEKDPIAKPKPTHSYPPKPPTDRPPRRRFAWFRRSSKKSGSSGKDAAGGNHKSEGGGVSWEDNWEQGEYPFVTLEGNRAACAICLMDFEEPKRVKGEHRPGDEEKLGEASAKEAKEDKEEGVTEEERLRLEDAGEGPQPLRLLACGHVFHQTCLDPWLTGVSGRCPVCQRPVELSDPDKKASRNSS